MSAFALDAGDERASLVGLLDELLDSGVHLAGDLSIGLADVELIRVALRLLVASEETASRTGRDHADAPPAGMRPTTPSPARPPMASETTTGLADGGSAPVAGPPPRPTTPSVEPRRRTAPSAADDERQIADGVARLVLTIIAIIHDLIERQAVRRVEAGSLTDDQVERLGVALAALEERMADVREAFGVTDEELDLDLGPLGHLR